jgi:hypothetical protein
VVIRIATYSQKAKRRSLLRGLLKSNVSNFSKSRGRLHFNLLIYMPLWYCSRHMTWKLKLPHIEISERTPLVEQLLDIVKELQKQLEQTREEIARLKGHKGKPKLKPSTLGQSNNKKRNKKILSDKNDINEKALPPDRTEIIRAGNIPANARFKGYRKYYVQELVFRKETILYKLERWKLANGTYVTASLPTGISGHFGSTLQAYVLHQHHHQGVTQPLLLGQLQELRFQISSGQLSNLLIEEKSDFHNEKNALLGSALSVSRYINVDDTGARHAGKNGYCTHIGNELFTWFESTGSKSRINFLQLLRQGHKDYFLRDESFVYMERLKLAPYLRKKLSLLENKYFSDEQSWAEQLKELGITRSRHIRLATEAALIGSVLHHGFSLDTVIMSDDAGQFNIFKHVLCWFHIERNIHKLMPSGIHQLQAVELVRSQIWNLYQRLKSYKTSPSIEEKLIIEGDFDLLCQQKTCYQLLNNQLKRIKNSKSELLLVLDRPDLPLHNNLSERDIREYVKRRKISGSTRSNAGRECRDTFASLKKTAKKLKVAFWDYLMDRLTGKKKIPWLPDLIVQTALGHAPAF